MSNITMQIKKHLSSAEISRRYRACTDSVERAHWHALWLMTRERNPMRASQAADVLGVTPDWIRKLVRRYNSEGAEGLEDKRQYNGNEPVLSETLKGELKDLLLKRPADGGLWTGPKVARWIKGKLRRKISHVTGWHYLCGAGFTLQTPRPAHTDSASPRGKLEFKKNSG